MTSGRPSTFTQTLACGIVTRLASGESLRAICRDENMPAEATVRGWVIDDRDGFSAQYARARDIGLDALADELLEIADNTELGVKTKTGPNGAEKTEGDMIEHRRLRVDSRKWYLSKLAPKKYGDKLTQELTGKGGASLIPSINVTIGSIKPEPTPKAG